MAQRKGSVFFELTMGRLFPDRTLLKCLTLEIVGEEEICDRFPLESGFSDVVSVL